MKKMRKLILVLLIFAFSDVYSQQFVSTVAASIGRNYTTTDTGPNGEQLFINIGDSNSDGRGTSLGPTTSSGTCYKWNGSSFDEITTTDVSNGTGVGSPFGTYLKQFALNYNARTAYKVYLAQYGSGGAEFWPNGDNNNWYTTGNLYANMKTEAREAMSAIGVSRPRAIFITLGINDFRSANSTTDILTGINSLVSRLQSDFPNVTIVFNQMGRAETGVPTTGGESFSARAYTIRNYLIDVAKNNSNVYLLSGPTTGIGMVSTMYNADLLHYSQTLNNHIGAQLDRLLLNKDVYSKWAASVTSSMFDDLSTSRDAAIATFIDAEIANNNYWKFEFLSYQKTTIFENCFVDWTFQGYLFNNTSIIFNANESLESNGTSNHYTFTYLPGVNTKSASNTDFLAGVLIYDNLTASGTLGIAFGGGTTTNQFFVGQNTTPNETYQAGDGTTSTYSTETSFVDNNFYIAARNGGTKYLIKNSTVSTSTALASTTANSTVFPVQGARNNNNTIAQRMAAKYQVLFVAGPYSTFDLSGFVTHMNTLIAAW
jgi:hypothetical protein